MSDIKPLGAAELNHRCDPATFDFGTTAELEALDVPPGQGRAVEAIHFGIGMRHDGYNLYLLGSEGVGKLRLARELLEQAAASRLPPEDCCYVNNFDDPQKPLVLRLPPGRAAPLRREMTQLVEDLLVALPAAFQTEEYRARLMELNEEFKERQEKAFNELGERARAQNVAIMSTPTGYTLAPLKDGSLISPDEYERLPKEEQARIEAVVEEVRKELRDTVRQVPVWEREHRQRVKALNEEVSTVTVGQIFNGMARRYADLPQVQAFLDAVRRNVIENVEAFREAEEGEGRQGAQKRAQDIDTYSVNVLVDHGGTRGAPVVYEDNPTYQNLIGRIEHIAQMGTLITDFTLIKPGALHKANGGYLLLDARKVLTNPFAWEGLKRALASREIRIQSLEQMLSLVSTLSLEPEPIPLDVKVVLVGDRLLYYLLKAYDPEFGIMFKVAADFAEDFDRSAEALSLYARMLGTLQRRDGLRPLDREAVARVIEESSRRAEDGQKVSLDLENLGDLLREADYWAGQGGSEVVRREHVLKAVRQQEFRQSQVRERVLESILRDIQLVDTSGSRIAQVNGLSVLQLGDFAFGRPSRITATVRLGSGKVLDIEREVELGGAIHSKGVLILSAYLADRYARERPLPIAASLAFEQSYGLVEGDSASAAELCALLSALGQLPLRQDLAVTGSVNQRGELQAIGGVNEKIEGFFAVCQARGLSGSQGVVIPRANVAHLMLRDEVIDAVREGRFHVYAVSHVEAVMQLLCGLEPGVPGDGGEFSAGSFNRVIQDRVDALWQAHRRFQGEKDNGESASARS